MEPKKLLGRGDMLFLPWEPPSQTIKALISDRSTRSGFGMIMHPEYSRILQFGPNKDDYMDEVDELLDQALELIVETDRHQPLICNVDFA